MTPLEVDWTMGVNRQAAPSEMADNEVYETRNLVPSKDGLTGRPPISLAFKTGYSSDYVPLALQGPVGANGGNLLGILWKPSAAEVDIASIILDGAPARITKTSVPPAPRAFIFAFGQYSYAFSNTPGMEFRYKWDGLTLPAFDFSGTGNANLYPGVAARYRDRAVFANFGAGYERHIIFSDNFLIGTVGDNALASRAIFVGDDGDHIVAMREISITGDRVRPALLVLLENSAFIITGQPNQTGDSSSYFGDMEVSRLPYNAGCASANTLVNTPYGLIWAGPDNVWLFQSGQTIIPIGAKIHDVLGNTPEMLRYRWSAAYFNGFFRLAVFSEGQGPDESSPLGEQWWLDLRNSEVIPREDRTARWYGPQIFNNLTDVAPRDGVPEVEVGTYLLTVDSRPGVPSALYGADHGWANVGGAVGVLGISSYGVQPGERDMMFDDVIALSDVPVGTEIVPSITSRIFGLDRKVAALDKIFRKGEAGIMVHDSARLKFTCNNNRGAQMDEIEKDINRYGMAAGQLLDTSNLQDKVQGVAFWPEPTTRNPAASMQFSLTGLSGYVIDATNDKLVFEDDGTVYVVSITRDAYTITDLLTEIVAQMNASASPYTYSSTRNVSGMVRLTTDSGATFKLYFTTTPAGATAAEVSASRRLGTILGFNTGIDATGGPNIDAVDSVYETHVPYWELYGMSALVKMTGSRPQ